MAILLRSFFSDVGFDRDAEHETDKECFTHLLGVHVVDGPDFGDERSGCAFAGNKDRGNDRTAPYGIAR